MLRHILITFGLAALASLPAASLDVPAKIHHRASPTSSTHATQRRHVGTRHASAHHASGHHYDAVRAARAATPVSLRRRGIRFNSPLKGSLESLERQNELAEAEGLERILDENDLNDRIEQKLLIPVPAASGLTVDDRLPESHRYCRPWTANFLTDLTGAHAPKFAHPLFVSSAVRTVEYQRQLMGRNGNAAAAEGDIVSPHLTGGTIDIAKTGMSRKELTWMRNWLLPIQKSGTIDVEEEFRQACFHITVYKTYAGVPAAAPVVATAAPVVKETKEKRRHSSLAVQLAARVR